MKIGAILLTALLWCAVNAAGWTHYHQAQAAPAAKFEPTEVQKLRLEVKQRDAQLAQVGLQEAQRQFRAALDNFRNEGETVKKENHWPETVQFDPQTLTFKDLPAPKPAEKPADKK